MLYDIILYQPLVNALIFLYETIAFEDLGVAIIILTICVRLLLMPLFQKAMRQQSIIQKLKPDLDRIEKEYKGDLEKKGRAQMELYRKHNMNPFSPFFILFLQIIFLIPLFQIFQGAPETLSNAKVYSFIPVPTSLSDSFLGLINLTSQSILLVVLATLFQLLQGYLNIIGQKNPPPMVRNMAIITPFLIAIPLFNFPAAVWLYFLVSNIFSVFQQIIINRELTAPQ